MKLQLFVSMLTVEKLGIMSDALENCVLTSKHLFQQKSSWNKITKLRIKDNLIFMKSRTLEYKFRYEDARFFSFKLLCYPMNGIYIYESIFSHLNWATANRIEEKY